MKRAIVVLIVCFIALGCTQRMICPAYQSAFIYDKEALRKKFSYFNEDSTPKILMASKTKYLIAEPTSYQKKVRTMETVEMKPVFPVVPDSLKDDFVSKAELDSAARSVIDSTYIVDVDHEEDSLKSQEDSIYVITKDKELRLLKYNQDSLKYSVVEVRLNVDQDNYMWYLRDVLVLPDVRLAKLQAQANSKEAKEKEEKKGFFGFFKNLFKKKKDKMDSTVVPVKSPDEFDYVDTLQTAKPVTTNAQPKKKGFFSFLKRNKRASDQSDLDKQDAEGTEEQPTNKKIKNKKDEVIKPEETKPEPAKKEEDKGDGF